ncbi:hypothetical protein B0H66DRAFT_640865 [Apodospora peruviana]|uniref:Uncharacterized protein n=1 Tax=Apodospora peruviana TaxID=516989 RepID=A0AAE0I1N3_9PEZI|nr:hypothetical protein B0H66DRAFT_640865 [Apodospora peruviana]
MASSTRSLRRLAPGIQNRQLPTAVAYRLPEFIIHTIDTFILGVFADSIVGFGVADIVPQRDVIRSGKLQWQDIESLYSTAEMNFRGRYLQRFARNMKTAHQTLWDLVRPPSGTGKERRRLEAKVNRREAKLKRTRPPRSSAFQQYLERQGQRLSTREQRERHREFIVAFWRICHSLLQHDLKWQRYEFSFLMDFFLELERLFGKVYGKHHPLHTLLFALCQVPRTDMVDVLRVGAAANPGGHEPQCSP